MRIKFLIDPSARKRDLEEITKSYNLPAEGFKYLQWRNEHTVSRFFYTWKMIDDFFKTNLQVGTFGPQIRKLFRKFLILLMFAGHQQDSWPVLLGSEPLPPLSSDRRQRASARLSPAWPPSGHQLRVVHLTSLHGKPRQDEGDPGQVCSQGDIPHRLHAGWVWGLSETTEYHEVIIEAHPTEAGDYIDYFLPINRHKTLAERLTAASEFSLVSS